MTYIKKLYKIWMKVCQKQNRLEDKLFWRILPMVSIMGMLSLIFTLIENLGPFAIISNIICAIEPVIIILLGKSDADHGKWYGIFCVGLNCFAMPMAFFSCGGLNSGMPHFCLGGFMLCAFCPDRKVRIRSSLASFISYITIFLVDFFHPASAFMPDSKIFKADAIFCFAVLALAFHVFDSAVLGEYQTQRFEEINSDTIEFLVSLNETQNPERMAHAHDIKAITEIMLLTANDMYAAISFHPEEIKLCSTAAMLQDIGIVSLPEDLRRKKEPLSKREEELYRQHPVKGAEIIEKMKNSQNATFVSYCHDICLYHHEKFDGTGYPGGIKGAEIPFTSQVAALADTYLQIIEKKNIPQKEDLAFAYQKIMRMEGSFFAPELTACFHNAREKIEDYIASRQPVETNVMEKQILNVAICSYNENICNMIRDTIERAYGIYPYNFRFWIFGSYDEFLKKNSQSEIGIAFLDSSKGPLATTSVAAEALADNPSTQYIFVENTTQNAFKANKCNAAAYISKPLKPEEIALAFRKALYLLRPEGSQPITIMTANHSYSIYPKDFLYSANIGNGMQQMFLTNGKSLNIRIPNYALAKQLEDSDKCFASCGKTYIVNMNMIQTFDKTQLIIRNGDTVPIPRRAYKELWEKYICYQNLESEFS